MDLSTDPQHVPAIAAARHQGLQTYLFVPAHEPRKAARALRSEVGAVILDLEAGVPEARKADARQHVVDYLRTLVTENSPDVWVRVNPSGPELDADLAAVPWGEVTGAIIAKADNVDILRAVVAAGAVRVIPLVESVLTFGMLEQLATVPAVERFAIGTWDLMLDLGLLGLADPDESELIWRLRGDLVLVSRRLRLEAPIDGVYGTLNLDAGFKSVCERAYRLGFAGKLLIHPKQISVATAVFGPNSSALQHAREVVEAYEAAVQSGRGAIQVNGQMVDEPVAARARLLLARWQERAAADVVS